MAVHKQELEVEGRSVQVSNLEKPFFPVAGFTKGQVIDFYIRVSRFILPHLKDRPVTLKRYPDGITGEFFYEKQAPAFTPDWVKTFPVPRRAGGTPIKYLVINDLPTLVWTANLATIEIHPFLHRAPRIDRPTAVVFDLDPGEGADILTCSEVAFLLKDLAAQWDLQCFPKVSGSKGLQVYVPLNTPVTYGQSRPFAKGVAEYLSRKHPDLIVAGMAKEIRANKVFVDWSQNSDFKTTVAVYSLRAKRDHPFVSVPVAWSALQHAVNKRTQEGLYFQPQEALERLEETGDLFEPVLKLKQRLPKGFLKELESA